MKNNIFDTYYHIISEDVNVSNDFLDNLINEYESKEEITKDDIISLLNIAVCDEILASFNYRISYNLSKTTGKNDFDVEFKAHRSEEDNHADKIINRLREMQADVLLIPWAEYLSKNSCGSDWKQETSSKSIDILLNRYREEQNAVKFYTMVLNCINKMKDAGQFDSTTERLIKGIKDDEEQHELDLRDLLIEYDVDLSLNENDDTSKSEQDDYPDNETEDQYNDDSDDEELEED